MEFFINGLQYLYLLPIHWIRTMEDGGERRQGKGRGGLTSHQVFQGASTRLVPALETSPLIGMQRRCLSCMIGLTGFSHWRLETAESGECPVVCKTFARGQ